MNCRSQARASSSSGPAKQLPGSISANRLRLVTSSRRSVRLAKCLISSASQSWPAAPASRRSYSSTAPASPEVLISQVPSPVSLLRSHRMRSSSSLVTASGQNPAPCSRAAAMVSGAASRGPLTVIVTRPAARSRPAVTCG